VHDALGLVRFEFGGLCNHLLECGTVVWDPRRDRDRTDETGRRILNDGVFLPVMSARMPDKSSMSSMSFLSRPQKW
jgi:hypothetical protein